MLRNILDKGKTLFLSLIFIVILATNVVYYLGKSNTPNDHWRIEPAAVYHIPTLNISSDIEYPDKTTVNGNSVAEDYYKFSSKPADEKCVKRIPQAIIIGIMKAGTTTMSRFLAAHPQVAVRVEKSETNYFSHHFNEPLSWYKKRLPCSYSNQITIDKSPVYFYYGNSARNIRKTIPNVKLILVVKDPITRAESMFAMIKEEDETFEEAVTIRNDKNKIEVNTRSRKLIIFSNYQKYIGAWLKHFERRQLFIIDSNDLSANPVEVLKDVERFLQIDPYFTKDMFVYNETKRMFHLKTQHTDQEKYTAGKSRSHEEYSSDVRRLLEDYFRPLNEKFFEKLGERFDWGY